MKSNSMTAIESLPVDTFELSETERQLMGFLFPSSSEEKIGHNTCPSPTTTTALNLEHNHQTCPLDASSSSLWDILQDVLLLVFCILLYQMRFWDHLLQSCSTTNQIVVKTLIMILIIICIKKFLSR